MTYIIRDTEYTSRAGCQEHGWDHSRGQYKEIIQVGAVRVGDDHHIIDEKMRYVRPSLNPMLSDYIQHLTGITQDVIDTSGVVFSAFAREFEQWVSSDMLYSYGHDYQVYRDDCERNNIQTTIATDQVKDIREVLSVCNAGLGTATSGTLHTIVGLPAQELEHDALGDAKNIQRVVKYLNIIL